MRRRLGSMARRMDRKVTKVYRTLTSSRTGDARNLIWMFGTGRTGSTWLATMMGELDGQSIWHEPLVGSLFGGFYYDRGQRRANTGGEHFIMSEDFRSGWLGSMRTFILDQAGVRFPGQTEDGRFLIVKEPNGTLGAPLILEAMPESRLVLLVRDPRDVTASSMDAWGKGGWRNEERRDRREQGRKSTSTADTHPDTFARQRARLFMHQVGNAKKSYDAHKGPKTLVRYEDLRTDTLGTMGRMYSELSMPVDGEALARSVHKHSWEEIPEDQKGEGKFYRKATPGGWREDLTEEQARIVEEITAPLIREFRYESTA